MWQLNPPLNPAPGDPLSWISYIDPENTGARYSPPGKSAGYPPAPRFPRQTPPPHG